MTNVTTDNTTDYLSLVQDVVRRASAGGAEAEVVLFDETKTELRVDRGQVEQLSQSGSLGMGVRVIDRGRVGYAYTSDFSKASIESTVQAALDLAAVASPDPDRVLPDAQPVSTENLEIYDPDLPNIPVEDKIRLAQQIEQAALDADPRVAMTNRCTYIDGEEHVYLANSRGFAGRYDRTNAVSFLIGIARDNGGMTSAFGLGASNYFRDLDPVQVGREAGLRAVQILGGQPVPTQRCTVIFDATVVGEILGYLAFALTGDAMQRGRSFLIGKMGQEVGSDKVTLLDNGRLKRGIASAPFDAEGVPTSITRLIDEGVLQNVIYDSYTARRAGGSARSTGNAQRDSHRGLPRLGPSNFVMQSGSHSLDDLIAGVDRGLYVTRVMQTGGINPINGDCSMGANGLWIENGKLSHAVNGVTVATTLPDLLRSVSAVGNDSRLVPFAGAIIAPSIRVDDVTIGGKG